jgi:putative SOS response-associated peptidase YedK
MCHRYALPDSLTVEREFLPANSWWKFDERSNIAPGQYVPVIRLHDDRSEGVMMRWGLVPSWAEGDIGGPSREAVDASDLDRSNAYRLPWLGSQRCILPMAGFYVWRLTAENYRQPYFVRLRDRNAFGVAAVWDRSVRDRDDVIESCSLIRVAANALLEHGASMAYSMPAILRRRDYAIWLNGTPVEAKAVLNTYREDWMQRHPVSPRINSLKNDDPALRHPIDPGAAPPLY